LRCTDGTSACEAAPDAWTPVLEATNRRRRALRRFGPRRTRDHRCLTVSALVGQSRAERRCSPAPTEPDAGLLAAAPRLENPAINWPYGGRRLASADGKFTGAIIALLEPERLRQFYRSIDVGQGSIWICIANGPYCFGYDAGRGDRSVRARQSAHRAIEDGSASGFVQALSPPAALRNWPPTGISRTPLFIAVSLWRANPRRWWASVVIFGVDDGRFGILLISGGS